MSRRHTKKDYLKPGDLCWAKYGDWWPSIVDKKLVYTPSKLEIGFLGEEGSQSYPKNAFAEITLSFNEVELIKLKPFYEFASYAFKTPTCASEREFKCGVAQLVAILIEKDNLIEKDKADPLTKRNLDEESKQNYLYHRLNITKNSDKSKLLDLLRDYFPFDTHLNRHTQLRDPESHKLAVEDDGDEDENDEEEEEEEDEDDEERQKRRRIKKEKKRARKEAKAKKKEAKAKAKKEERKRQRTESPALGAQSAPSTPSGSSSSSSLLSSSSSASSSSGSSSSSSSSSSADASLSTKISFMKALVGVSSADFKRRNTIATEMLNPAIYKMPQLKKLVERGVEHGGFAVRSHLDFFISSPTNFCLHCLCHRLWSAGSGSV
jgi:hypothetical protein